MHSRNCIKIATPIAYITPASAVQTLPGDRLEFTCAVRSRSGAPLAKDDAEIGWERDDVVELPDDVIIVNGTLVIESVHAEHEGMYI